MFLKKREEKLWNKIYSDNMTRRKAMRKVKIANSSLNKIYLHSKEICFYL